MKKRVLTAAAAGLMSASMIMSAFAANGSQGGAKPYSDGTDVYAGVILKDENEDARLRVYVPTLFAFVVNGSVRDNDAAISVENNNLLLPNVKVDVDDASGKSNQRDYSIQTVGEGHMYFENCSTALDDDRIGRKGIAVTVKGSIKNEGTLESRNYWEHIGTAPSSVDGEDFKKYRLSVDDIKFSESKDGAFEMSEGIDLSKPDLGRTGTAGSYVYTNLDSEGYAITGATKDVEFGVEVGGVQGNYKQVEESAKVGSIVWTISYDIENKDDKVPTAPDNTYQKEAGVEGTMGN